MLSHKVLFETNRQTTIADIMSRNPTKVPIIPQFEEN
jgi:hypothetical protein